MDLKKVKPMSGKLTRDEKSGKFMIGDYEVRVGDRIAVCFPIPDNDWMVYLSKVSRHKNGVFFFPDLDGTLEEFLGYMCSLVQWHGAQ